MANKKNLVALDGSEQSERAFHWYLEQVHQDGNQVILVSVPERPVKEAFSFVDCELASSAAEEYRNAVKRCHQDAEKVLRKFELKLKDLKIDNYSSLCELGKPGEVICDVAKREEVSAVVLGSRGLGMIRRTLLGSVSDYVLHHCDKTVIIVPQPK